MLLLCIYYGGQLTNLTSMLIAVTGDDDELKIEKQCILLCKCTTNS